MEKIIAYNEYYTEVRKFTSKGKYRKVKRDFASLDDINTYYKNDGYCPFCKMKLIKVFDRYAALSDDTWDLYFKNTIWECPSCGWWCVLSERKDMKDRPNDVVVSYNEDIYYSGIVKSFDLSDKELPLDVLYTEMLKNQKIIYEINPYKLEQFTQSVLSDFFDCEVKHVGRTGDGGKDLIVVQSDEPILVQVKRRRNPEHIELVKGVREFVGTLFIDGSRKGIYVTTAKKFSKGCEKISHQLLTSGKLDYFNLIDYNGLLSMLNLNKTPKKIWSKFTKDPLFDESGSIGKWESVNWY